MFEAAGNLGLDDEADPADGVVGAVVEDLLRATSRSSSESRAT